MTSEYFASFAEVYRRFWEEEPPRRLDTAPAATNLPSALRLWLDHAPADLVKCGGAVLAGSNTELAKWRKHEAELSGSDLLIFGFSEDGGGYLAVHRADFSDDPTILIVDHESGNDRVLCSFSTLIAASKEHMEDVLRQGL